MNKKDYSLKRTVKIKMFVPFSNSHLCGLKITEHGNFLLESNKLKIDFFISKSLITIPPPPATSPQSPNYLSVTSIQNLCTSLIIN